MTKPYATHARSKVREWAPVCGTPNTDAFADEPTCKRCLDILSGTRRIVQHRAIPESPRASEGEGS